MSAIAANFARGVDPFNVLESSRHGMWVILLEIGLALGLAAFIVWWTWPKKRAPDGAEATREKENAER